MREDYSRGRIFETEPVNFIDEKSGWLIGFSYDEQTALVYQTQDGGVTWQLRNRILGDIFPLSSYFSSRYKGWLTGNLIGKKNGYLARTEDGGSTWTRQETPVEADSLTRIVFQDDRHSWLISRDSIYRTQDGGDTWQSVFKIQKNDE